MTSALDTSSFDVVLDFLHKLRHVFQINEFLEIPSSFYHIHQLHEDFREMIFGLTNVAWLVTFSIPDFVVCLKQLPYVIVGP